MVHIETFAKYFLDLVDTQVTSFPRRRESSLEFNKLFLFKHLQRLNMDSRLRGNDVLGKFKRLNFFQKSILTRVHSSPLRPAPHAGAIIARRRRLFLDNKWCGCRRRRIRCRSIPSLRAVPAWAASAWTTPPHPASGWWPARVRVVMGGSFFGVFFQTGRGLCKKALNA